MANNMIKTSLGEIAAKNLADVTKTPAYNGSLSPRWLLRLLPWANTVAGLYRVNRLKVVGDEFSGMLDIHENKEDMLKPENLRKIPVLAGVSKEALIDTAKKFKKKSFSAGNMIFEQGQPGEELYIVMSGKVDIFTEDEDGKTQILNTLQAGHFFGERSLLAQEPRNASARAIAQTVLLQLDGKARKELMKKFPKMGMGMEEAAAQMEEIESSKMNLMTVNGQEMVVTQSFAEYEEDPLELTLSSIITTLRINTRVMDLYKQPYDQLREQVRHLTEAMKERQEWELINNRDFGVLKNMVPAQRIPTRTGPPTPDDMDELISKVWKEPSFFLAHPRAIAAFGRECTQRGVPPATVKLFNTSFLTWRGVPIIPCDKIPIEYSGSKEVSKIILMRVGESRRGVVGVHQANIGDERLPSFAIRFNGVDPMGIANYLISVYFSLAFLANDAAAVMENVELGHYGE